MKFCVGGLYVRVAVLLCCCVAVRVFMCGDYVFFCECEV